MKKILLLLVCSFLFAGSGEKIDEITIESEQIRGKSLKISILCINNYVFYRDSESGSLTQHILYTHKGTWPMGCDHYLQNFKGK